MWGFIMIMYFTSTFLYRPSFVLLSLEELLQNIYVYVNVSAVALGRAGRWQVSAAPLHTEAFGAFRNYGRPPHGDAGAIIIFIT